MVKVKLETGSFSPEVRSRVLYSDPLTATHPPAEVQKPCVRAQFCGQAAGRQNGHRVRCRRAFSRVGGPGASPHAASDRDAGFGASRRRCLSLLHALRPHQPTPATAPLLLHLQQIPHEPSLSRLLQSHGHSSSRCRNMISFTIVPSCSSQ